MNIDFHYGVIYAMARIGGLAREDAQVVAHACQYVDDATTDGILLFAGGERYSRIATAHELLDFKTLSRAESSQVWVPFHFFPAGLGTAIDEKAVCRPDSAPVRDMLRGVLAERGAPNGLHRLGIALHTYVDTWAHQGFSGVPSVFNIVRGLVSEDGTHVRWRDKVRYGFRHLEADVLDRLFESTAVFDGGALVGHGAALSYPDRPWAVWHYDNGRGERVRRDNLPDFLAAADHACRVIRGFVGGVDPFDLPGLAPAQHDALRQLLGGNHDENPLNRLAAFAAALEAGVVPGLKESLPPYVGKGEGSWKHLATGLRSKDDGDGTPVWTQAFEDSDYRHFHDGVKQARLAITLDILPRHGMRLT
jgi:hypothetical protein